MGLKGAVVSPNFLRRKVRLVHARSRWRTLGRLT